MPDRVDVALAILTLVLAVVAILGRLLLGVLVWGECLLLALRGRRVVIKAAYLTDPNPSHGAATARDAAERRPRHNEARAHALARMRDLIINPGQE